MSACHLHLDFRSKRTFFNLEHVDPHLYMPFGVIFCHIDKWRYNILRM